MEFKQHYIKNSHFKTILGSGVFGGVSHNGMINMVFFTERVPLPEYIAFEIDEVTGVQKEISREVKDGAMRELQVGVLLDLDTAKATVDWLNRHIKNLENIIEESAKLK